MPMKFITTAMIDDVDSTKVIFSESHCKDAEHFREKYLLIGEEEANGEPGR